MSFTEYFSLVFSEYTLRTVTLGTAILGALCGVLGSFALLKKQSLLGDAISHAALPGIAIAFLITGYKDSNILMIGALVSGLIGSYWIRGIIKNTHLKTDTALGITLSIFFGFGMLIIGYIQDLPNANQAGLDEFLFGQASTLTEGDVILMASVLVISFIILFIYWKELKLLLFDSDYARTIGFNTKILDLVITSLIVTAIVIGLKTVGVVLMSAILLAPAAAARQWTNRLSIMVLLACIFGSISGIVGSGISSTIDNMPTGPVIILVAFVFVIISLIFSPERGLLFKSIKQNKNRDDLMLLRTLSYIFDKTDENYKTQEFSFEELRKSKGFETKFLEELKERSYINVRNNKVTLTETGYKLVKTLFNK